MTAIDYERYRILAKLLAHEEHVGQTDLAGRPYIEHVIIVAFLTHEWTNDPMCETVAWLHDIVEDTPVTIDDLIRDDYPTDIIEAVKQLTHQKGQPYIDYIDGIQSPIARKVKMVDLVHNMDTSRFGDITVGDKSAHKRIAKYRKALKTLASSQSEIDALHQLYDDLKNDITTMRL